MFSSSLPTEKQKVKFIIIIVWDDRYPHDRKKQLSGKQNKSSNKITIVLTTVA